MTFHSYPQILLLLLPFVAILTHATEYCVYLDAALDDYTIKVFKERISFLEKVREEYTKKFNEGKGGSGFNFTKNFPIESYELERMRQRALDFYWHGDVDEMQQRYHDMEFLALLDGLQMLEKHATSRLEPYVNQTEKAKKLEDDINQIWQEWKNSQQSRTRRQNCDEAVQIMHSDWRDYRLLPSQLGGEFLRDNLRSIKNNAATFKDRSAKLVQQLNRESWNPLYHLRDGPHGLNMISHIKYYEWAERFFDEYLAWLDQSERPAPGNCVSFEPIAGYRGMIRNVEKARQEMLVFQAKLAKKNFNESVNVDIIKDDLEKSSPDMKSYLRQSLSFFSDVESDKLYKRYQLALQIAQAEALVDFYSKLIPRLDDYKNQNKEYFTTPSAIDPVPIEKSLDEINQEFERVARMRNRGCEHWSTVLEEDLKASKGLNPSSPRVEEVRKTFDTIKKAALDMKARVSKLYDEVPRDHSRYLHPGTELALIEAEKKYQRLADLFSR